MAKYSQFIDIRPGYESVVDLGSDERNPNLWREYVVHEDMNVALEKICASFKMEDKNQRRSFWIHGAYGSGKSYAGLVLKHLFTDKPAAIEEFFDDHELIRPRKNAFMSIRNKGQGDFLLVWNSGTTGIADGSRLMMEMEFGIRQALAEKFGDKAYFGESSLVEEAQRLIKDEAINWEAVFNSSAYRLSSDYGDVEEFRDEVLSGDKEACAAVSAVCRDKGWAVCSTVERFKAWIADVIRGNGLSDKGIIVIWDEFTDFVRNGGEDNVLQNLSEFCKDQPFFMFLIVHVDPSWLNRLGEETYNRIMHRYHKLEFRISENAALDMIADTIQCRNGMERDWDDQRGKLVKSLRGKVDEITFGFPTDQIKRLCPIHPTTLRLLTKVSESFAASQRTLFSFMKDQAKADKKVGFLHYIATEGPDDWRWLTIDYLWDYFFSTESDFTGFNDVARKAFRLFEEKQEQVEKNQELLRVLKAVYLLIAVMSTDRLTSTAYLTSVRKTRNITATGKSLRLCFAGQLAEKVVDDHLQTLSALNLIDLEPKGDDSILNLPYGNHVEKFDLRFEKIRQEFTRYALFKKNGEFARSLENALWPESDALSSRIVAAAACDETNSVKQRLEEVRKDLLASPNKFGVLAIVASERPNAAQIHKKIQKLIVPSPTLSSEENEDVAKRLIVCVLQEPLSEKTLDEWYRAKTHLELAKEEGKGGEKDKREQEASVTVAAWSAGVAASSLVAFYGDKTLANAYGFDHLRKIAAEVVFDLFDAAPERILKTATLYKKSNKTSAQAGVAHISPSAQFKNIEDTLSQLGVWNARSIDELADGDDPKRAPIAKLARFIRSQLTQGSTVKLDELWETLQRAPFGYADNIACAYLLGFVLRFWQDSDFNWLHDGAAHPLNEENLQTLILNLCQKKTLNETLSSGTETWRNFKEYLKNTFGMSAQEVVNELKARQMLRARTSEKIGVPIWAYKYVDVSELNAEDRDVYVQLVDLFSRFALDQNEDQEKVMSSALRLFSGKGRIRKLLSENFKNQALGFTALKTFICDASEILRGSFASLELNDVDLADDLRALMQSDVYSWTEEQTRAKVQTLALEYELIAALNFALDVREKKTPKLIAILRNKFLGVRVPGAALETLNFPWFKALNNMRSLTDAESIWKIGSAEEKREFVDALQRYGREAWQNLVNPAASLEKYVESLGVECQENDTEKILSALSPGSYDAPEPSFKKRVEDELGQLEHERAKERLKLKWSEISRFDDVEAWCQHYQTPIQWVVPNEKSAYFAALIHVFDNRPISKSDVENALQYFENELEDFGFLQDETLIEDKFIAQINPQNLEDFQAEREEIMKAILVKCGSKVSRWATDGGKIKTIVDDRLHQIARKRAEAERKRIESRLLKRWDEISGFKTIDDWGDYFQTPILWVVAEDARAHFKCVAQICARQEPSFTEAKNALDYFENNDDFEYLSNSEYVRRRFLEETNVQAGDIEAFEAHYNEIVAAVKKQCGSRVYDWRLQSGKIAKIIKTELNAYYEKVKKNDAVKNVQTMNGEELRRRVIDAMHEFPELYRHFA